MLHETYNQGVLKIWDQHAARIANLPGMSLVPMQRGEFFQADLLFVGMNPSFAREDKNAQEHERFRWPGSSRLLTQTKITDFIEAEKRARTSYKRYYARLENLARIAHAQAEFIDLLPMRHTNQGQVLEAYCLLTEPLEVAQDCFRLFASVLKVMQPPVIVVANSAASRLLQRILPLHRSTGAVYYTWAELHETKWFLSGMITGRRPLDRYSYERLGVEVANALERDV